MGEGGDISKWERTDSADRNRQERKERPLLQQEASNQTLWRAYWCWDYVAAIIRYQKSSQRPHLLKRWKQMLAGNNHLGRLEIQASLESGTWIGCFLKVPSNSMTVSLHKYNVVPTVLWYFPCISKPKGPQQGRPSRTRVPLGAGKWCKQQSSLYLYFSEANLSPGKTHSSIACPNLQHILMFSL